MKYIHIALFGMMLASVAGCKTHTVNIPLDPYVNVNVDFVKANCKPVESFKFPVFGIYTMPARLKSCAGVDDMFVVAWPGKSLDLEQAVARVLTLLYVRSHNLDKDPDIKATFLKHSTSKDETLSASFYELSEVPAPSPEKTTPQE